MGSSRVTPSKLDAVVQLAGEPVFWTNADRKLLGVNRAWETFTGLPQEMVVGLDCRSIGGESDEDPTSIVADFHVPQEAIEGRSVSSEARIRRASGERVWKRIDFSPLHTPEGDLAAILGFVREKNAPVELPAAESDRLRVALLQLREGRQARLGLDGMIGKGEAHRRLLDQIETAAKTTSSVVIVGEPGTGKRLVAQTIHQLSKNKPGSVFAIDCEALPADLLERGLFGTEPNFGESAASHRFDYPEHSTLILENGLSLPRDLQEQIANSDGSKSRWIVTSCADPETAFREERLRADFFYRITTLVIRTSPLRERIDELPLLAQAFLERANARMKTTHIGFSDDAIDALRAYDWPGNLLELSRVITAAMGGAQRDRIERKDLPAAIQGDFASSYLPPAPPPRIPMSTLDEILVEVERKLIEKALIQTAGNKSRAAEFLGISRPRLHRRINELKIADGTEPTG